MNESIRLRWEKPTERGVRYREVDLDQDLWGEWRLTRAWGRRGTRLGQIRVVPCGSRDEGLARIAAILERRRQRRYRLVAGADPGDDNTRSLPARRPTARIAALPEPRAGPGHDPDPDRRQPKRPRVRSGNN